MVPTRTNEISQTRLDFFKQLLYKYAGIHISPGKEALFEIKIQKMLRQERIPNLGKFYRKLKEGDEETLNLFLRYTTTNWTFFYREKESLQYVLEQCKKLHWSNPIVWSAAASTGEEPYSLAIMMELMGFWDYVIMASDIDRVCLHKASRGIYSSKSLLEIPKQAFRYFKKTADVFKVKPNIRERVKFRRLDLREKHHFAKKVHIITLRNVLIYFDEPTKLQVVQNVIVNLIAGGFLVIGKADMVHDLPKSLKKTEVHGVFHYNP